MARDTPRILVVEDDDALRDLLENELEDDGSEVATASSAEQAAEILEGGGLDLVVSDLRLPGADGLALLDRTRSMEYPPAFIVITRRYGRCKPGRTTS